MGDGEAEREKEAGGDAAPSDNYGFDELMELYGNDFRGLDRLKLSRTSPHELGQVLVRLAPEDQSGFLKKLSDKLAGEILSDLPSEDSAEVLVQLKDMRALRILSQLEPDDAAYIVRQLDDIDRDRLLGKLPAQSAKTLYDLLSYDKDTAGGVMTPHVNRVNVDWTVDEAIATLRREGEERENLDVLYAIDGQGRLVGSVTLHRLIQAQGNQKISQILNPDVHGSCHADDSAAQVAQTMADCDCHSVPILDAMGRLVGIVTHDDVIDILQESATRDMQILHGAGAEENIHDPVRYSVIKRNPWLLINLLTAAVGALVVSFFQKQIEELTILAVFMTLITSLGGNAGGQTLAVAIRSLALGEWRRGDTLGICIRETFKGLFSGILTGLVAAVASGILTHNSFVGLAIFLAMVLNMALCGLSGALIPYVLQKMNFDPAQSAYIFLTMVTDTVGMYIFLRLGCWLLL
ncbi:MAG: magnesium transporter [Puniceicoccales bacterium]|jgi:magnesium transporter|nr:magnesium transporter [Puniceicoccales bacterium]